jgi:predicted N-acyltransferase
MRAADTDTTSQPFLTRRLERVDDVDTRVWNALEGAGQPFLRHEFLSALEHQNCVGGDTGWLPRHITVWEGDELAGAMPLYAKLHSWGEFVFDWSWAEAYREHGLAYYPKLVCAVPFSPVGGARLLTRPGVDRAQVMTRLLRAATSLAEGSGASSVHLLFAQADELALAHELGWLRRSDCRFVWHNRGYGSFDDFLASMSSAKRKKIRRERQRVQDAGIRFEIRHGGEIDGELWRTIYALYASTFTKRGHLPYCTPAFFEEIGRTLPAELVVVLARLHARVVATALFLEDAQTLYGRYWGCDGEYHSLHFETCYYQGIARCIDRGLAHFDPGAQGEHKLARGFEPTLSESAHHIRDPRFAAAIARFLERERAAVNAYVAEAAGHLPFRTKPRAS